LYNENHYEDINYVYMLLLKDKEKPAVVLLTVNLCCVSYIKWVVPYNKQTLMQYKHYKISKTCQHVLVIFKYFDVLLCRRHGIYFFTQFRRMINIHLKTFSGRANDILCNWKALVLVLLAYPLKKQNDRFFLKESIFVGI
jgi:hypothetical protein